MIYSYLLHGYDIIQILKIVYRRARQSRLSVQFEDENDVTPMQ